MTRTGNRNFADLVARVARQSVRPAVGLEIPPEFPDIRRMGADG
jgi:hypothetical protein